MMHSLKMFQEVVRKILFILNREQRRYGVVIMICSLIGALFEVLGVGVILPLVQAFMNADVLMSNPKIQPFIDALHIQNSSELILWITVGVILIFIIKNLYFIFLSWIRVKYSCKVSRELSSTMMRTYMKRGYEFFLTVNSADISRNINADVSGVNTMLYQLLRILIDGLTIFLIVIYMMITDWIMAVSVMILALICLLIIYGYFRKKMRKAGELYNKYNGLSGKYLIQALHGIKEILVMNKREFFVRNFEKANIQKQYGTIEQTVGAESPAYIIEGICISGLLGTVCLRILFGGTNVVTLVPALSAFAVGAFRILPSLGRISSAMNTALYYIPSLDHVYNNLNQIIRYDEHNEANEDYTGEDITDFKNSIQIIDIGWHYKGSSKNVISHLNLEIKRGQSVAFVGMSGAGKTTLADIILGLLHPQEGKVLVDGRNIAEVNGNLSHIMGYVPQSVYLTDDTIRNNVAFGLEPEDIDDQKIWAALRDAQMKDFVEKLENGLDTMVGDRGIRFSGGQRQRIAIARALYENPDIIVFDEATASLDTETETAVMESIKALQGHKTLIIIAHRLTTIKDCDVIYEIKDGVAYTRTYEEIV